MRSLWWFTLPLLLLATGVAETGSAASAPPELFLTVRTDKPAYQSHEVIAIALVVLNQGTSPLRLTTPTSQQFDIYLCQNEQIVWRWSQGRMFAQALAQIVLEPAQPQIYVAKLDPKTLPAALKPGPYQLVGLLRSNDNPRSKPWEITIRP